MNDWRRRSKEEMMAENAKVDACEAQASTMSEEECKTYIDRMIAQGGRVYLCERTNTGPLTLDEMRGIVADFLYLEDEE